MSNSNIRDILDRLFPPKPPMPFFVDCPTLSREILGDAVFERELNQRKNWMSGFCAGEKDCEGIRNDDGVLVGRRFTFELEQDAVNFKLFFG